MSEDKKEQKEATVTNIDDKRMERMARHGHYFTMVEQFELLRLKFVYNDTMTPEEGIKFITMCKYFAQNGHSEPFKYSCEQLLKKYVKPHGL